MKAGANARRVTVGAAPGSARGLFARLCRHRLHRLELGELAYRGVGVAVDTTCTTTGRTQHGTCDDFGRNGAPGLARSREQWIDHRRQDGAERLERPRLPAGA